MFVKFDVVIEFVFTTFTRIFFNSFCCYANFFLLFRQFLYFFLEFVFDFKLMFLQMIIFDVFFVY